MKKMMMKYLMVNCKEATFLMAKNEEGKLSLLKKMELSMHIIMCSFCKKFEKQSAEITKESSHIHADNDLPNTAKERIEKMLMNQPS